MTKHRHRPHTTMTVGYRGTAAGVRYENRSAHGAVCIIDTCRCGAKRETNSNGRHDERGPWLPARDPRPAS